MWTTSDKLDLIKMAELARSYYGESDLADVEFLSWEYYKNPTGLVVGYAAYNGDNDLIAQVVAAPVQLLYKDRYINASFSFNTITHPAYRGRGIY